MSDPWKDPSIFYSSSSRSSISNASDSIFLHSETILSVALAALRRALGDAHEDTLAVALGLGELLYAHGRLDDAEPLLREALAGSQRLLGDAHPRTLALASNLGSLLRDRGARAEMAARAEAAVNAGAAGFLVPGLFGVRLGRPIFLRPERPEKAAIFAGPCVPGRSAIAGAGLGASRLIETVVKVVSLEHEPRFELEVGLQRRASAIATAAPDAGGATWLSPAVLAVGYGRAFAYVLMEAVAGASLADALGEERALRLEMTEPAEAARVRAALVALARAGIFFPDRTPYNFMRGRLGGGDAPESLVAIDFGGIASDVRGDEAGMARAAENAAGRLWNRDMTDEPESDDE